MCYNEKMPISIDATTKFLKVKALPSKIFAKDRNNLASLPNRTPIYGLNSEGKDEFQYWEIPLSGIPNILEVWDETSIICTPAGRKAVDNYKSKFQPLNELPREELKVKSLDPDKPLRDYQEEYITINASKRITLGALCTGSGKSLSSILRAENLGGGKILIIGPRRLDKKWKADVREDIGKDVLLYVGTKPVREKLRAKIEDFDVFYTNFEQLKEFSQYCPKIDHVIVDEIHCVCNPDTKLYKSLYSFLRSCQGSIQGLSATPIRHKLEDLWGVLNLLDPDFAGSKKDFLDKYQKVLATMDVKKSFRQRDGSYKTVTYKIPIKVTSKNEDGLREKLKGIMFRVKKEDIVDFKDQVEIIDCEITLRQRSLYEDAVENLKFELSNKTLQVTNTLTKLLRLLQISEGLFNFQESNKYKDSGKLDWLKEELKEKLAAGEKVIVWSRFEPITREIQALFPNQSVIYSGKVSDSLRDLGVWAFQGIKPGSPEFEDFERLKRLNPEFKFSPGEAQLFTATHSLRSGMGLNLQASHICYYTSFDPSDTATFQARDRISRLGQTFDTESYFLVAEQTWERRALKKMLTHYNNSLSILDEGGSQAASLTKELIGLLYG